MCEIGSEALSLDSLVNFKTIAPKVKNDVVLIGNLDPVRVLRDLTPDQVKICTRNFLEETKGIKNLILSSGCDLPQDTPIENIEAMIEEGKIFRR